MKIKDFLREEISLDVIDDVTDDLWIAFEGPVKLTEEGEKHFKSVLGLEVKYINREGWGDIAACVLIDHRKDWERLERKCIELFEGLAGYCSADDWDRWFVYGE